jgi:uncharacterized protein (DUF433 family)
MHDPLQEARMARYPLNLPVQLKVTAEQCATQQGVSLNQFILWAVSEKVGELRQQLDDPAFPHVTYRRGASGQPTPVVRGAGIRVQTLAVAAQKWGWGPAQISAEYGIGEPQVREALVFYETHRQEIEAGIGAEQDLEEANG